MTTPRLLSNRYELGETLGYGGMSEVHRGRDVRLGREVAVKVLRADLARDPQFQERFRREAQNAAALNHPAIVAVYDTGETRTDYGPLPYIVMEYVDGRTLRDIVKTEGPMSAQRAMEIMADVCAALDFSHRHGIVHRDVKPANVMINRTGAVKVMDFGIARAVTDGQVAVTQTAAVIGTAQYLSPEQARGEAVDARSDVYATGCVLFELLTGEPPFTGDSPVAVAYQHVREDPKPPSALNPRVPPTLDAIVLKAMAKGAANRYQSAAEMRNDLVRVLSGQRPMAPMVMTDEDRTSLMGATRTQDLRAGGRHRPAAVATDDYDDYDGYGDEEEERRRRRRKGWMIALIVLLVLALILLAVWLVPKLLGPADTSGDTLQMPDLVNLTESEARAKLTELGHTGNVAREEVPCGQPGPEGQPVCSREMIGKVIDTRPQADTEVAKTDKVTLVIGGSPEQVKVPDVTGKAPGAAKKELEAKGFKVGKTTREPTEDSAFWGKVKSQSPLGGQLLERGGTVDLIIGKKPPNVDLPNVTGKTYDDAKAELEALDFTVVREDVTSEEEAGIVVGQNPPAGPDYSRGTTVTLQVSNGEGGEETFVMPNLVGTHIDDAEEYLRSLGWTGDFEIQEQTTDDPRQDGVILQQTEPEGTEIPLDAAVPVLVAKWGIGGG